ncbi:MAG: lysylphosphatidylglycerol synthase transmembrane domain-containing protein [Vicinamibacterales bacterium]
MRTAVRTLVITGLAVGLLVLFLRNADLARVGAAMRTARWDLLALTLAVTALTFVIRAERWQYLLSPLGPTRFSVAFRTTMIGFAASALLPARAGEVLRPYLLAKREGLDPSAAFATVVVERILDLAAVLALLAVYLVAFDTGAAVTAPALYHAVRLGAAVMAPIGLGALVVMMVLAAHPERLHGLVLRVEHVLPARIAQAVANFARSFALGLAVVRRPGRLLAALGLSLLLWLLICATVWLVARALAIDLPFPGSFLLTAMVVVGVAIPTPGGVGGVHEAYRLGATAFFGAPNDAAIGAAILFHATGMVPVLVLGLWFAARDGLSMGRLKAMTGEASAAEVPAADAGRAPLTARR